MEFQFALPGGTTAFVLIIGFHWRDRSWNRRRTWLVGIGLDQSPPPPALELNPAIRFLQATRPGVDLVIGLTDSGPSYATHSMTGFHRQNHSYCRLT
jgi:hypothetical protein